ncbi:MAG: YARHG domain-containing protein [Pseudoramibacter sp.]|jgi:hypothetical protein
MKCNHCGANLDPNLPYCQVCGAPNPNYTSADYDDLRAETDDLTDYSQDPYYDQSVKREKQPGASNTLVIIVAIVCAAAVAVTALYFLMFRKSSAQTSVSSGSTQSESSDSGSSSSKNKSSNSSSSSSSSNSSSSSSNWMSRTYILPDSTSEYLSSSDISGFSAKECNYALNEIYAREGRRFKAAELQNYFDSKSWYNGTIDPDDFDNNYELSDIERANVELLKNAMDARGGYTPE